MLAVALNEGYADKLQSMTVQVQSLEAMLMKIGGEASVLELINRIAMTPIPLPHIETNEKLACEPRADPRSRLPVGFGPDHCPHHTGTYLASGEAGHVHGTSVLR